MSAFKDAVATDVKAVFLNADEFSDYHEINGERVLCQIDKNMIGEASDTQSHPLEGVFVNTLTIYVDSNDIEKPVEGQLLSVDDSMHIVRSVRDEMGVLVIVAEAHDQ
jgi:hypothetical protein